MNSLAMVLIVIGGLVLIYSAVKGEDPREVVKRALAKGGKAKPAGRAGSGIS